MWPQEIGAIVLLDGSLLMDADGQFRLDAAQQALAARLHLVRRFRQVVHQPGRGLGGPMWVDDPSFDIGRHLGLRALEAPVGDESLAAAASALWREPMDPDRPPWRMWFLTGLSGGRVGLFVRIHHAVADGRAAMAILDTILDRRPDAVAPSPRPWAPRRLPSSGRLLADRVRGGLRTAAGLAGPLLHPLRSLRRIRDAVPAVRELIAEPPASLTSLNRVVGPGRSFAMVRADLHRLRRAARAQGATVTDLVLSITGAGLQSLLGARGEPTEGTVVRAFVPVSMRRRLHGGEQGTEIAQMVVPFAVAAAAAGDRLRRIATETRRRKARTRMSVGTLFVIGFLRRRLLELVRRQRVNVSVTFLPGPRRPRYLAGARVLEIFPTMNLIGAAGLGVCATCYDGALTIGVTADEDAYPDLDRFVTGLREEVLALQARGWTTEASAALNGHAAPLVIAGRHIE
jgi:WS/DGAT/MGAT family acyltransferase